MSNYKQLKKELCNYIYARTPLVVVNTNERQRIEIMLREIVQSEVNVEFLYYTDSKQVRSICSASNKDERYDTSGDPLGFFTEKLKKNQYLNVVLGDVKRISDENVYSRDLINLLYAARESRGTVILITTDQPCSRISSFGMMMNLDLPDTSERISQIAQFIKKYQSQYTIDWNNDDVVHAAALLRGFSEIQIENILSAELVGQRGLKKNRIYEFASQKQKLYPRTGAVQNIRIDREYRVAGMDKLKLWLDEKKKVFFLPDEILRTYDLKSPKGLLLVGVPGCGKSLTAKLVAQEWELPLYRFDIGSVFDKWVGGSEKNMKESLQFIENVSPCVLWIDEIEKVLATGDSGNESGKRVLGEFLFWIQETESKVFMVATANSVKDLPYELYRKGRFSEIFFAGLPNDRERRLVIEQYIRKSMKMDVDDESLDRLVGLTDRFSYSDIETAVKEVAERMLIGETDIDALSELEKTLKEIIPISKVNPELVEAIEKWGHDRAIDVSLNGGGYSE